MAVVFGYAGAIKLYEPQEFALAVYRYHLIPDMAVNLFSLGLAGLEVVTAIALLCCRRARVVTLYLQMILLVGFSAGISITILNGSHMSCGCMSVSPMALPLGWLGVLKNLVLVLLALGALSTAKHSAGKRRRCGALGQNSLQSY
jgi:hypothetical protein